MGGEAQVPVWPVPKFYFSVSIPGVGDAAFQEVSGLEGEAAAIEVRAGGGMPAGVRKLPGQAKAGFVTLHRGIVPTASGFLDWAQDAKLTEFTGKPLTVSLLDEAGEASMVWTLSNARPLKISCTNLSAGTKEIAVESVEVSHDGITLSNG